VKRRKESHDFSKGRRGAVIAVPPGKTRITIWSVLKAIATVTVFVVVRVLPGDPALVIIGPEGSPEAAARLREALGLNRPILVQYTEWLARALRGDLGVSLQYDVPVGLFMEGRVR